MFPRLLSLFVLALTSLSSLAVEEVVWIQHQSNSMCLGVTGRRIANSEVSIQACDSHEQAPVRWKLDKNIETQVVLNGTTFYLGIESIDNPNNTQLIIQNESQLWKYDSEKMHFRFNQSTNNGNNTEGYCMSLEYLINSHQAITTSKAQIAKCDDIDSKQKWVLNTNVTQKP